MHCDCAISRFSFPFFAFLFWQMGNNKLHLFLARQREEREGETSPDKVLHGDCVYSSLQGVCNNNGYDFIEPQKFPLVSLLPPPKRPRNNWAKWLHSFRFKTDQSEWGRRCRSIPIVPSGLAAASRFNALTAQSERKGGRIPAGVRAAIVMPIGH